MQPAKATGTPTEQATAIPTAQVAVGTASPTAIDANASADITSKGVTMAELANHATAGNCWLAISGSAYNVSNFTNHPGGDAYVQYCGKDATQAFNSKGGRGGSHSQLAQSMMAQFLVGTISG